MHAIALLGSFAVFVLPILAQRQLWWHAPAAPPPRPRPLLPGRGRHQGVAVMQAKVVNPGPAPVDKPPEDGEHTDGDMILPSFLKKKGGNRNSLNFADAELKQYRWPKENICYVFDDGVDSTTKQAVLDAIKDFETYTCLRFRYYTSSDASCIKITIGSGCYSMVGMAGGNQTLSLGTGCGIKGIALHEFMHNLGFDHEQNRADRDDYVTIQWAYVSSGKESNFEKSDSEYFTTYSKPYDYGSVMHYGAEYFTTTSGSATITPKDPTATIGQRQGLSTLDIEKINTVYECTDYLTDDDTDDTTTTTSTTTTKATTTTTTTKATTTTTTTKATTATTRVGSAALMQVGGGGPPQRGMGGPPGRGRR